MAVGPAPEIFKVHQHILCRSSEFFKCAMKPEWSEQRDDPNTIDMSTYAVEEVKDYISWLYTDRVDLPIDVSKRNDQRPKSDVETLYTTLGNAYLLGESLLDKEYKDTTLKQVVAVYNSFRRIPGPKAAGIIYAGTPASSPARRLLVDLMNHGGRNDTGEEDSWMETTDECSRELLVDAIKARFVSIGNRDGYGCPGEFHRNLPEQYLENKKA